MATACNSILSYGTLWACIRPPFECWPLAIRQPITQTAFLYVLPVEPGLSQTTYDNGLDELRKLDVQNQYNATIVEPIFPIYPWYADSATDATINFETFTESQISVFTSAGFVFRTVASHSAQVRAVARLLPR